MMSASALINFSSAASTPFPRIAISMAQLSAIFSRAPIAIDNGVSASSHDLMIINGYAFEALLLTVSPAGRSYQESTSGS
jgi:hypothetical protein